MRDYTVALWVCGARALGRGLLGVRVLGFGLKKLEFRTCRTSQVSTGKDRSKTAKELQVTMLLIQDESLLAAVVRVLCQE